MVKEPLAPLVLVALGALAACSTHIRPTKETRPTPGQVTLEMPQYTVGFVSAEQPLQVKDALPFIVRNGLSVAVQSAEIQCRFDDGVQLRALTEPIAAGKSQEVDMVVQVGRGDEALSALAQLGSQCGFSKVTVDGFEPYAIPAGQAVDHIPGADLQVLGRGS